MAKIPDFHLGYSGSISRQENKVYSSHCTLLSPRDHSVTKQKDIYVDNKQYVYKYLNMPLKLHSFLQLLKSTTYFLTSSSEIISYICNIVRLSFQSLNFIQKSHDPPKWFLKSIYNEIHSLCGKVL